MSLLFLSLLAFAQLKVGVIDTGLSLVDPRFSYLLCKEGHQDYTGHGISDTLGHGTQIVSLIKQYAKDADYCLVILKYYQEENELNSLRLVSAIRDAAKLGVTIINISGGGKAYSEDEYAILKLHPEITFVVAAGNNNEKLELKGACYYPACYQVSNIQVVGALHEKKHAWFSNYGPLVKFWEQGQDITADSINEGTYTSSGTSFATAIHTGKLIKKRSP